MNSAEHAAAKYILLGIIVVTFGLLALVRGCDSQTTITCADGTTVESVAHGSAYGPDALESTCDNHGGNE